MSPEVKCPICGRKFVRGLWDHYAACSRSKQVELDREWDYMHPLEDKHPNRSESIRRA